MVFVGFKTYLDELRRTKTNSEPSMAVCGRWGKWRSNPGQTFYQPPVECILQLKCSFRKNCSFRLLWDVFEDYVYPFKGIFLLHYALKSIWLVIFENWLRYSFIRNIPNLLVCRPTPAPPTALTIKGVYVITYSWCG